MLQKGRTGLGADTTAALPPVAGRLPTQVPGPSARRSRGRQRRYVSVSKTVLVVDDEMIICLDIQMQLDAIGHRTLVASTYADAVRIVETGAVDIVVLDWHLRDRSADSLAAMLRHKGIPFVLCSGSTREELAEVFPNIPVVTKPYMTEQLVAALDVATPGIPL